MTVSRASRSVPIALLLAGLAVPAVAAPVHVRGTVAAVTGPAVTIATNDGKTVGLTLDEGWRISGMSPASLADVKPGSFIGTANVDNGDGNMALEVVVFPESMRGTGEGDYGWDLKPKSSMTNATVKSQVEGVKGRALTLSYKGGEKTVTIPPNTPIVMPGPGSRDDIKPGAKVFVAGEPSEDGAKLTKGFIAVGKDGAIPPM